MDQDLQFQEEYIKTRSPESSGFIFISSANDKDGFNTLYNNLYIPIYHFACRFVNPQDAEDITADSFLKLWKSDVNYSILPKVKTWLHVCTRNACIDLINKQKKRSVKHIDFAYFLKIHADNNQEDLIKEELLNRLHQEIEKLPRQCKRIFKLAYLEGQSSRQIATDIGISENTVSNHRIKALKLLKLAFSDYYWIFILIYNTLSVFFAHL